jgi:hypothetical protein
MFRVLLVAVSIFVAMVAVKNHSVLERAHLTGYCTRVSTPVGDNALWRACHAGRLSGRPDLSRDSCVKGRVVARVEYWRCPAQVSSSPAGT